MMWRWAVGACALVVYGGFGGVTSMASADVQPAGQAPGLAFERIDAHTGRLVFRSSASWLYRGLVGRRIVFSCGSLRDRQGSGFAALEDSFAEETRVSRRRRSIRIRNLPRRSDVCRLARIDSDGSVEEKAAIALTAAGAIYLDERHRAAWLYVVFSEALDRASGHPTRYPTARVMVSAFSGPVVELGAPHATPPPWRIGYFSDATRIAIVATTASGRRLFVEYTSDGALTTNVAIHLAPLIEADTGDDLDAFA